MRTEVNLHRSEILRRLESTFIGMNGFVRDWPELNNNNTTCCYCL